MERTCSGKHSYAQHDQTKPTWQKWLHETRRKFVRHYFFWIAKKVSLSFDLLHWSFSEIRPPSKQPLATLTCANWLCLVCRSRNLPYLRLQGRAELRRTHDGGVGRVSILILNQPCQHFQWEETGVPGENPRLLAERWLTLLTWVRTHDLTHLRGERRLPWRLRHQSK